MLRRVSGSAALPGLARCVRIRLAQREPPLARARVDGSIVGHYAFLIAVSVYAYGVGGEKAVGLIFLARLIPAALVAPFAGMLGDRYPRERVLLVHERHPHRARRGGRCRRLRSMRDPWVVYGLSIAATIANDAVPLVAGSAHAQLARTPERAHSRERGRERHREHRGLRRPGARRRAACRREHGRRLHAHRGARRRLDVLPAPHQRRASGAATAGARGVDDRRRAARRVHDARHGTRRCA